MNKTIEERGKEASFQHKVNDWVIACFGEVIASDIIERNHRFIEEALELIQSTGATAHECHQLVDYVFSRPVGERNQELGGVMVTLAALANAIKLDMSNCGNIELERVWQKIEKIREKQANKPKHSPLPQTPTNTQVTTVCAKELRGEAGCKEMCDECKGNTLEKIKIDGEVFEVDKKVELLLTKLTEDKKMADRQVEIHLKAVINSARMLNECKYAVARIFEGRDDMPMWALGEKLRIEWDAEVKYGLTGWIQNNWGKLCHISCDCGSLISYDVLRESTQLMCKRCYYNQNKNIWKNKV